MSYKGTVNFDVYYRTSSSSSWVKTTSSSYYEIDNDYDNGYTFSSSNDGQKTLNNFIRFKKDDYSYKIVVTDEDNDDTE
jgi:lipopolysaccharide export LptBFGC system permease protein LptF